MSTEHERTPQEILKLLFEIPQARGAFLDPCAGDGTVTYYVDCNMFMSTYGIEPDPGDYNDMQKHRRVDKALNERASGVYARGFSVVYAFPPPGIGVQQAAQWLDWITDTLLPHGIVMLRLPMRRMQNPDLLSTLAFKYDQVSFYKDPEGLSDVSPDLVTVAARLMDKKDRDLPTVERLQEIARQLEICPVLSKSALRSIQGAQRSSLHFAFRIKGLEWEDVYKEVYEVSWPRLGVPFAREFGTISANLIQYQDDREKKKDTDHTNYSVEQAHVTRDSLVWCDLMATHKKGILALSMVGRRVHIENTERGLKASGMINVGRSLRGKLIGGGSQWQDNYHRIMMKLPGGAFHCVWFHRNATAEPIDDSIPLLLPTQEAVAAKMIANLTGLPVVKEWVAEVKRPLSTAWRDVSKFRVQGDIYHVNPESVMGVMSRAARDGLLPEPGDAQPEVLRPIMTPSSGIWAQLAMQEFVNDVPMKDNGIIMHSTPIELLDTEVSESLDDKIEVTNILRRDAVRISVFHYKMSNGFSPGDWEVYQSETADMLEEEEDDDDD